jgi:hypothetical protein
MAGSRHNAKLLRLKASTKHEELATAHHSVRSFWSSANLVRFGADDCSICLPGDAFLPDLP